MYRICWVLSKDYLYIRANNAFALAALMSRVEQYIHVVVDMLMTMKNVQVCVWFPCAKQHYTLVENALGYNIMIESAFFVV